jgi:hypothetical protein
MAKKKTITDANKELRDLVLQTAIKEGEAAESKSLSVPAPVAPKTRDAGEVKAQIKLFKEWTKQLKENTKTRIWTVDLGGGTIAQVSTELINWGIRAAGRWSGDGWWARQNDLLQGLPHIVIGALVYIGELATRADPSKTLPSPTRAVISEASKLFYQLGFSKLVAAVRSRYADGQNATQDLTAARAEVAALKEKNKQLEATAAKA